MCQKECLDIINAVSERWIYSGNDMDPTKVAVTVPVTNVSGVTNDLKEGSRVNIYAMGEILREQHFYSKTCV